MEEDKKFHPITFYSYKFSTAEINFDIHDKKFLLSWIFVKSGVISLEELYIQ